MKGVIGGERLKRAYRVRDKTEKRLAIKDINVLGIERIEKREKMNSE